jgi:hypothetical protein
MTEYKKPTSSPIINEMSKIFIFTTKSGITGNPQDTLLGAIPSLVSSTGLIARNPRRMNLPDIAGSTFANVA